jgi:hypothetical protein
MITHNADVQISNAMDMGMNNPGFGLDFGFTFVKLEDNERNRLAKRTWYCMSSN